MSFLGVRHDLPALLRAADAFAFPSLWEGAANALVEAMGLGVPAAVTDDPALREIAGDGAVYFAPKDPPRSAPRSKGSRPTPMALGPGPTPPSLGVVGPTISPGTRGRWKISTAGWLAAGPPVTTAIDG